MPGSVLGDSNKNSLKSSIKLVLKRNLEKEDLTFLNHTKQQRCGTEKHKTTEKHKMIVILLSRRTLADPVIFQSVFYLFRRPRVRRGGRSYHPALFGVLKVSALFRFAKVMTEYFLGAAGGPGRA